jgi:Inner membrane protein YgaP-like, transmembrane domain
MVFNIPIHKLSEIPSEHDIYQELLMKFRKNVGLIDRVLRTGLGSLFIYLGFLGGTLIHDPLAGALLGGIGVLFVVIAMISWCPLYNLIDFSTANEKI